MLCHSVSTSSAVVDKSYIAELFNLPFFELIMRAQMVHRQHFNAQEVELCTLLNIKAGACPEDCGYCSQSGHHRTELKKERMWSPERMLAEAKAAKDNGATRVCMGAAWRSPPEKDFPNVVKAIKDIHEMGMETCVTLGMLTETQALALKEAGLDYYNHNLDTSPEYYDQIVSTHSYEDRLQTLAHVRNAGINVCCGGILGMGESREDRISLLNQFAQLPKAPESIPINRLTPIPGTPLADAAPVDNFEFIRTIAVTRILMPTSMIRLSAGRADMSEEMQAWCFMAGANSMWLGEKLLTVANSSKDKDMVLFAKLGMQAKNKNTKSEVTC